MFKIVNNIYTLDSMDDHQINRKKHNWDYDYLHDSFFYIQKEIQKVSNMHTLLILMEL